MLLIMLMLKDPCCEIAGHGRDNYTPVFQATGCSKFHSRGFKLVPGEGRILENDCHLRSN